MTIRTSLTILDGLGIFPPILSLAFCGLLIAAPFSAPVAAISSGIAGALFMIRSRGWAALAALLPLAWLWLQPAAASSIAFWTAIALMTGAAAMPTRALSVLARFPRGAYPLCIIIGATCLIFALVRPEPAAVFFTVPTGLCAALLGAAVTRGLALADARILTWGEEGLTQITRDLLLGRITSGMLHDLAQPLNVISMANGNLSYIIEHIVIEQEKRTQIAERIRRISANTENAASVLSLFRWFGRMGGGEDDLPNVRSALERAIAATKSNVRHAGVSIDLSGDALDYLLAQRHGTVEMMAVAALLSAFGGFILTNGTKVQGKVLVQAVLSPTYIVISFICLDEKGVPSLRCEIDRATLWLVEQIARESGSEFRFMNRRNQPLHFSIRVPRDDI